MSKAKQFLSDQSPWALLLWTGLAGLLFGLVGFGEIAEDYLRTARNSLHKHPASGDIVLIDVDDASLREMGRLPWPRGRYAELVDKLDAAGSKRIFIDIMMDGKGDARNDELLAGAIARSGKVVLPALSRFGPDDGSRIDRVPLPSFTRHGRIGSVTFRYNYQNAVWALPYGETIMGKMEPSFASLLADAPPSDKFFKSDYSLDPATIPRISIADIFNAKFDPRQIAGKDVIVGVTSAAGSDIFFVPGTGRMGGAYVHIIGAETLKAGSPVTLGWWPALVAALAIALVALRMRNHQTLALSAAILLFALGPALLESRLIFLDVMPGLFVLICVTAAIVRRHLRTRGLTYTGSNLPNLNALQAFRPGRKKAIVAARILNYEEALATLPTDQERNLVEQVIARLTVGDPDRVIYQGDSGIFAWFAEPREPFGNHLEALHALFRNPARIDNLSVDLAISFGVELGSSRSLSSRLASALVSADEAARDGLKWKMHDPETLQDASWRLSMLSQLDSAIDKGEVWVAYQPKLDLKTRRIIGCEALARWTHPDKGPIAASEFVAAAEQQKRIGKLTDFVLEQAIVNASALVKRAGGEFDMAVNMSASILTDRQFALRLSALLARHGLDPRHLTLELTETAALASTGEGLEMIGRLRDLGVGISIDDYGTGLSTLDYLKRVPANEIKIDQSFVKGITDNRSDRLMVQSTIELAHSLGRRVVAEGAELREHVDLLVEMNCDIAQGYAIGRPMSLESLTKRIVADRKRSAA